MSQLYHALTCEMADEARLTSVGTSASLGAPIKEVGVLAAGVSGGVWKLNFWLTDIVLGVEVYNKRNELTEHKELHFNCKFHHLKLLGSDLTP